MDENHERVIINPTIFHIDCDIMSKKKDCDDIYV